LLNEVFNLSISEGAIANLLTRVKDRLVEPLAEIPAILIMRLASVSRHIKLKPFEHEGQ